MLDFAIKNCSLVAKKVEQIDVVESIYGILDSKLNTKLILDELRGKV